MDNAPAIPPEKLRQAFLEYERPVRIRNYKVGCLLAFLFMPAGASLDYFVYPEMLWPFFKLRCLCSVFLGLIWLVLQFRPPRRFYRVLGFLVALLPLFFISGMIYATDGALSPYYAGLNLVMLGAALLLRWTLLDSVVVFVLAVGAYLLACQANGPVTQGGVFFNNFYFLFVTGVFIVTGSWYYNRLRLREFELRFELDRNRAMLEESNQKLLELDQIKGRFFANISHELRTPLTLLISPLESIMNRFGLSFDEETRQTLGMMHANALRLLKLINDLLDLVRLDSGVMKVKREPVAVGDFVRGLTSAAQQMATDKRVDLVTTIAPEVGAVMLDRDKLEKIVLNLQFNALKFTPSGGRVEVKLEREGGQLALRVIDTGIGIPKDKLPQMFERFFQVDSSTRRKYQGVGIGLALVKELVEVQDGTVAVESEEGKGSTFTVRMPYLEPPPDAQPAPVNQVHVLPGESAPEPAVASPARNGATVSNEEWLSNLYHRANFFGGPVAAKADSAPVQKPAADGARPTLVVADDQPDMLRFLTSQLNAHYNVIEAIDGQQAVDKAVAQPPDLILLDMMMPEKDGLQACRELREHAATRSIPIVLLTARADEAAKLAALSAGASDFLHKPFSTTELHVRVRNLIESYDFQRQLALQNQKLASTIEELKETETLLVQSEKLASLGRMSAGLIHEINNPLNFATTGLYTLRNKARHVAPEQQNDYAEILKDVEEGIGRVKTIVSDLRSFTHPDTASLDDVPVRETVTAALRFLSHEAKDKVRIEVDLPEGLTVQANKNTLTQVLLNLMQNSLDALAQKSFNGERPLIRVTGREEAKRSVVIVRDNGTGIAPEIVNKIFDPFFTTKDVGEGMGLGLSICYRIIEASGGRISVRSEPGNFSEFTLEFPARAAKQY